MYQLILTNRAIADMEQARDWYNEQQQDLGNRFLDYTFKTFDDIQKMPFAYPNKYKHTRELVIKKFPYVVIYSVEEQYIFVLRVYPARTNPKKKYK